MNEEPNDKPSSDHIPDRQRRIIQRVASGEDWRAAARAEGCADSYSKVIRARMMKNPAVARKIKQIQAAGSAAAGVTLAGCIAQAQADRESARRDKAHMAAVQATKLVCQLCGHLVDKVEVVSVDLTKALALAESRVLQLNSASMHTAQAPPLPLPSKTAIRWPAAIAGDPAAGQADDESVRTVNNRGPEK